MMNTKAAIDALSQGEKIKTGLIWASQIANIVEAQSGAQREGGLQALRALIAMIGNEAGLAGAVTKDTHWEEVGPILEKALVMIDSGVPQEAGTHLAFALSKTTGILQRAMTYLMEQEIL